MAAKGARDLNRYGELQEDTSTTKDELGRIVPNWTRIAKVWFRKEGIRGMEVFQAAQLQAVLSHKITLRFRARIHARMRIVEALASGDKVYHFAEPPRDPDGHRVWLEVMAKEDDLARET